MQVHTILILTSTFSYVNGFGAPGIIPPETFIAERWYPSNLATVMPPWKVPGADITSFRTARTHQPPGTLPTTTPSSPTNSLPMPPGSSELQTSAELLTTNGPHPPAPQPDVIISSTTDNSIDTESNTTISGDEPMIISVTATNSEKAPALPGDGENGILKVLSPDFEDITKIDNISDSQENNLMKIQTNDAFEGSGDDPTSIDLQEISINITTSTETSSTTKTISTTTAKIETTTEATKRTTTENSVKTKKQKTIETTTLPTTTTTEVSESSIEPSTQVLNSTTSKPEVPTTKSTKNKMVEGEITVTTTVEDVTTTSEVPSTTVVITLPDNTTTVQITTTENSEKECKDILFLLDSSGNVLQQYEKQKRFIEEIVNKLERKHERRMALITYSGRSRQKIVVPLPNEPNAPVFLDKLKKSRFLRGVTATGAALSVTTQYVLQKGRNVQVVVVTDGFSFDDVHNQAEALRSIDGIETYTTGRYFPIVKNVLLSIGGTANNVFFDKTENKLFDALQC